MSAVLAMEDVLRRRPRVVPKSQLAEDLRLEVSGSFVASSIEATVLIKRFLRIGVATLAYAVNSNVLALIQVQSMFNPITCPLLNEMMKSG
jgi:hypothetical protein